MGAGAARQRASSTGTLSRSSAPAKLEATAVEVVATKLSQSDPAPIRNSSPRECSILARRTSFKREKGQHKIIALGNAGIGKTSLLYRLATDTFVDAPRPFEAIEVACSERSGHKLIMLDTADQEQFRNLTGSFYRGVELCFIVVDVTNGDSYFDADLWLKDVDRYAGRRTRRVLLVATKCDATAARVVDNGALKEVRTRLIITICGIASPGSLLFSPVTRLLPPARSTHTLQWAHRHRISYFEVSARTGEGCAELMKATVDIVTLPSTGSPRMGLSMRPEIEPELSSSAP